jgi:hypothetical protein
MFKNGKVSFVQAERTALESDEDADAKSVIENHRECMIEFMAATDRLSWQTKNKIKRYVTKNIHTYPEDIAYKLINSGSISLSDIKGFKIDIDKVRDKMLNHIELTGLDRENLEKFFVRGQTLIQSNPNGGYDESNFYRCFINLPEFAERTSVLYLDRVLTGLDSHYGSITPTDAAIIDGKHHIIAALSGQDAKVASHLVRILSTGDAHLTVKDKIALDPDIYKAVKAYILQKEPESLKFLKNHEKVEVHFNDILLRNHEIGDVFFALLNIKFIDENYEALMKKGNLTVKAKIFAIVKFQDRNEKFLIQNPELVTSIGHTAIFKHYNDSKLRVINPDFVQIVMKAAKPSYYSWDAWKNIPDFREEILVKIREEKRATKVRKRTSVLTTSTPSEVLAQMIYEDHIEARIESLVEETYHKYETIMEDKIGQVIYEYAELGDIIENTAASDSTFKRFYKDEHSVRYNLYREIGNFARGTEFFTKNMKTIEKNIRTLKEVKKVVEG